MEFLFGVISILYLKKHGCIVLLLCNSLYVSNLDVYFNLFYNI